MGGTRGSLDEENSGVGLRNEERSRSERGPRHYWSRSGPTFAADAMASSYDSRTTLTYVTSTGNGRESVCGPGKRTVSFDIPMAGGSISHVPGHRTDNGTAGYGSAVGSAVRPIITPGVTTPVTVVSSGQLDVSAPAALSVAAPPFVPTVSSAPAVMCDAGLTSCVPVLPGSTAGGTPSVSTPSASLLYAGGIPVSTTASQQPPGGGEAVKPVPTLVAAPSDPLTVALLAQQLPSLPNFNGKNVEGDGESFSDWLERLELVATACKWDNQAKLVNVATRLRGTASRFYRSCTPQQRSSYDEFCGLTETLHTRSYSICAEQYLP